MYQEELSKQDQTVWRNIPPRGPILKPTQAARYVGFSRSLMYAKIKLGCFPPVIKIGERSGGIPQNWLDAFIVGRASVRSS